MPREPALRNICRCPRTSLPPRSFHPTDHVQQDIHPPDNPPPSARKSVAGNTRRRVGRRRGRLPSSTRQNPRALMMQSSAPAPGAPSPWKSALGAKEDSISQCVFYYCRTYYKAVRTTSPSATPPLHYIPAIITTLSVAIAAHRLISPPPVTNGIAIRHKHVQDTSRSTNVFFRFRSSISGPVDCAAVWVCLCVCV